MRTGRGHPVMPACIVIRQVISSMLVFAVRSPRRGTASRCVGAPCLAAASPFGSL